MPFAHCVPGATASGIAQKSTSQMPKCDESMHMICPGTGHGMVFPAHVPEGTIEGRGVATGVCDAVEEATGVGIGLGVVGAAAEMCEMDAEVSAEAYDGAAPPEHPSPVGVARGYGSCLVFVVT